MPGFYCSCKNDHKKPVLQSEVLEELAIRLLSTCDNFYFQIADFQAKLRKDDSSSWDGWSCFIPKHPIRKHELASSTSSKWLSSGLESKDNVVSSWMPPATQAQKLASASITPEIDSILTLQFFVMLKINTRYRGIRRRRGSNYKRNNQR